jgi:hypothetical protein
MKRYLTAFGLMASLAYGQVHEACPLDSIAALAQASHYKTLGEHDFAAAAGSFWMPNEWEHYEFKLGRRRSSSFGDPQNAIEGAKVRVYDVFDGDTPSLWVDLSLAPTAIRIVQQVPRSILQELQESPPGKAVRLPHDFGVRPHWAPTERRHAMPIIEMFSVIGRLRTPRAGYQEPERTHFISRTRDGYEIVQRVVDRNHYGFTNERKLLLSSTPDLTVVTGVKFFESVEYPKQRSLRTMQFNAK